MGSEKPKIETTVGDQQLGEQYWKEQRVKFSSVDDTHYRELRDTIIGSMKKSTGEGGNEYRSGDGTFINGEYIRQYGKLDEESLKKMAGRRLVAAENGLQVGPYEIKPSSDTAVARVTDVARLQNLIFRAQIEKKIQPDQADILELNNLLDRATANVETLSNRDAHISQLAKLVAEWESKFPGQDVTEAIVGSQNAVDIHKDKQGDKPVIVAPYATAELFKMKFYIERAREKLLRSPSVELDAKKMPVVIHHVWRFIRDAEKGLYPDGYYVVGLHSK